ncbi:MAG: hypothetical protein FJZ78_09030 [Bacteroidetes bacterium]|nr:hypothetical protein [Bacteroidota bacterium]
MTIFLKLLFVGFIILIAAIGANVFTQKIGIVGWYDFLSRWSTEGGSVFSELRLLDYLWLFIGYPTFLGLAALAGDKCWQLLK